MDHTQEISALGRRRFPSKELRRGRPGKKVESKKNRKTELRARNKANTEFQELLGDSPEKIRGEKKELTKKGSLDIGKEARGDPAGERLEYTLGEGTISRERKLDANTQGSSGEKY